ncbi:hypothetical protein FPV67DRAFT_1624142 [Lyophyllum atratum]|nr:hypothetical protein FPV67DRAFT_1624142 [Lyophyllum atratum]
MSALPPELLQLLNQAYMLHVVATDPAKVLPPGKSLLSVMARAPPPPDPSPLHAKVEKVVHKAFWDEAVHSLSSPSPSVQLSRLKLLYSDLFDAFSSLFPPRHPILLTLTAPLPPTSSPLHSTLAFLKEILLALRQRCAPARDPEIDALLADLTSPPAPGRPPSLPDIAPEDPLAVLLVSTMRTMIALADTLKRDLTNTVLGAMSEAQLSDVIRQQARTQERELILNKAMWGGERGIEVLTGEWTRWLGARGTQTGDVGWTPRLIQALASSDPVTCLPSNPNPNALPPQFFFSTRSLLYLQNYLQGLVVAAALKSLVRLPARPAPLTDCSAAPDFVPRIWSLLKTEIDRDEHPISGSGAGPLHANIPSTDETKTINLADEVIRARRLFSSPASHPEEEERDLRAAVERTLRLTDPVFMLLQARLIHALEERVGAALKGRVEREGVVDGAKLPGLMRTGRAVAGTSPLLINGPWDSWHRTSDKTPLIKGFEDEVLVQGIEEVIRKVLGGIEWVEIVWGDTISSRSAQ